MFVVDNFSNGQMNSSNQLFQQIINKNTHFLLISYNSTYDNESCQSVSDWYLKY